MNRREAIALEYGKSQAPVVVAQGSGDLADLIIEEARRQGVFIAQDPQLLALLGRIELNEEIPPECYAAVAVVLAWAYRLRGLMPEQR
ncbi:MAG: Flagellar biosynthetic protein FlhB [Pseudomonadota bacterium]|jgi:flagellar biosynthesis protein